MEYYSFIRIVLSIFATIVHSQSEGCFPKSGNDSSVVTIATPVADLPTCHDSCAGYPYYAFNAQFNECFCYSRDQVQPYLSSNSNSNVQGEYEILERKIKATEIFEDILTSRRRRNLEMNNDMFNTGFIGAGFSYDTLSITTEKCFNTREVTITNSASDPEMNKAYSFTDIMTELNLTFRLHFGFCDIWRVRIKTSFENKIRDTATTFSINFFQFVQRTITGQLEGYGLDALNDLGKGIYQDGENPYFGMICGDEYVTKYAEGGLLIISFNLIFNNAQDMENFKARLHIGAGFSIFGVTTKINQTFQATNISGFTEVLAFQEGGDPSKLSKIFAVQDASNPFYCSFSDQSGCQSSAVSLINYAAEDFPNQFKQNENVGYIPLGEKFADYKPVKFIGLKKNQSIVRDSINEARSYLLKQLEQNVYFQEYLAPIVKNYPVSVSSAISTPLNAAYNKVINNLEYLISENFPRLGIQGCFDRPDECQSISNYIQKHLQLIQQGDLEFLDFIKYTVPLPPHLNLAQIYPNGNQTYVNPAIQGSLTGITSSSFTPTTFDYTVTYTNSDGSSTTETGSYTSEYFSTTYTGWYNTGDGESTKVEHSFDLVTNPYYFVPKYYPNCNDFYMSPIEVDLQGQCFKDGSYYCKSPLICLYGEDGVSGECGMCSSSLDCNQKQYCKLLDDGLSSVCQEMTIVSEPYGDCNIDGEYRCDDSLHCKSNDIKGDTDNNGKCVPCIKNNDCSDGEICFNEMEDLTFWECIGEGNQFSQIIGISLSLVLFLISLVFV